MNGHRALYKKIIKLIKANENAISLKTTDKKSAHQNDISLGYHLCKNHGCHEKGDFNKYFRFTILQHCSPGLLDIVEHKTIHKLKTLEPWGINSVNPFGIPII